MVEDLVKYDLAMFISTILCIISGFVLYGILLTLFAMFCELYLYVESFIKGNDNV